MNNNSATFTLTNGTTAGAPQNMGAYVGGTTASPDWWGNAYWAMERQYRLSINLVGALQTTYTGVEVRGIAATMPGFITATGTCSTSCASGSLKRIQLDSLASALSPQGRTMHEAGHVASYLLKPFTDASNYCWTGTGTGCTWSRTTAEWAAASFEEAFATFIGDVTIWHTNATVPTTCISSGRCPVNSSTRLEETHWAVNPSTCDVSAGNPESRWPISSMRMLWDVYDTVSDAAYETVGEGAGNFWRLFANMTQYPSGINDHQIDEPWQDAARTVIDPSGTGSGLDGRSSEDYEFWYANYVVIDDMRDTNCGAL